MVRNIGAYVYNNLQLGYNVEPRHTRFEAGVANIANKQPPLYYSNNVGNANTDVATYDLLGPFLLGTRDGEVLSALVCCGAAWPGATGCADATSRPALPVQRRSRCCDPARMRARHQEVS